MCSINITILLGYLKIIIIIIMITAPKRNGEMEFEVWPCPLLVTRYCD